MKPKYIVAVSGGVDSVVLLNKIMANKDRASSPIPNPKSSVQYVVAHFDHGIRGESSEDAEFVKNLAKHYDLEFVLGRGELGLEASEEIARDARYKFLFEIMKSKKANGIVAAHHQDDVLETMLVNMIRGTSPRGLVGFTMPSVLRPMINMSKEEILKYAKKHDLSWVEDSTNNDENYLRNYIRWNIMPKLEPKRGELLSLRDRLVEVYDELDTLSGRLLVQFTQKGELFRSKFVVLPYSVQKEVMAMYLRIQGVEIDRQIVERAVFAAKVLKPGKFVQLKEGYELHSNKKSVSLIKKRKM